MSEPDVTGFRPGAQLSARPLHFFFLLDGSGSMADQGKIHALNSALRSAVIQLADVGERNPFLDVQIRAIVFADGCRWHVKDPVPVASLVWRDIVAGGFTDLGAALTEVATALHDDQMPERSYPPVLVLVSDGQPTDDYAAGLADLLAEPWGGRSVRTAIAIGEDADMEVLEEFVGDSPLKAFTARDPGQLTYLIRFVSSVASQVASTPAGTPGEVPVAAPPAVAATSEWQDRRRADVWSAATGSSRG